MQGGGISSRFGGTASALDNISPLENSEQRFNHPGNAFGRAPLSTPDLGNLPDQQEEQQQANPSGASERSTKRTKAPLYTLSERLWIVDRVTEYYALYPEASKGSKMEDWIEDKHNEATRPGGQLDGLSLRNSGRALVQQGGDFLYEIIAELIKSNRQLYDDISRRIGLRNDEKALKTNREYAAKQKRGELSLPVKKERAPKGKGKGKEKEKTDRPDHTGNPLPRKKRDREDDDDERGGRKRGFQLAPGIILPSLGM